MRVLEPTAPSEYLGEYGTIDEACDPAALRRMDPERLSALATEIRELLVDRVGATGGHLGPNLGVVELTIALHRVFASPRDRLLFDTGHQAYVHKMLTGRRVAFDRLRQPDGLSGYPSQAESVHDVIENSHASTALSYADGLAKAYGLQHGESGRAVVAVVGDGALTGGMCWEALNNIGDARRPVIVVLNDNGRSYAPTRGSAAAHLRALREHRGDRAGNLFTILGFAYIGPVDGHDIATVEAALHRARALHRPVVVHCVTVKGRGYAPAETDAADCLHGVGVIDPDTGRPARPSSPTWTDVFADAITAVGERRPDVVCLTASMLRPVGLARFAERFPDRVFDVGIAEQHAVCSAAGLALGGLHPVVAVYATFLSRAFDQVLMDVALHRLPVTFVLDRAGITGPDGASHHGMWDLSFLCLVPGLRVAAPRDATRLRELLTEAVEVTGGPAVLRFPKANVGADIDAVERLGRVDVLHRGRDDRGDDNRGGGNRGGGNVLLVACGPTAGVCLDAAAQLRERGIESTVVDPRWVVPVDPALVGLAAEHRVVLTVEDNSRTGGAGALLAQACTDAGLTTPVHNLGLPRRFLPHAERGQLLVRHGYTGPAIADAAQLALAGGGPFRPEPDRGEVDA